MGDGAETKEEMETPGRSKSTQIPAKFEDSPVFNFLNNLSPIKPVKSSHISETINPLTFSSLPSVFTSPQVRESRFLRRHQLSDPSKPEFSSDDGNNADKGKEILGDSEKLDEQNNLDAKAYGGEMGREASYQCSKLAVGSAENFSYAINNANDKIEPSHCLKAKHLEQYTCKSLELVPFVEEASQRDLYVSEGITEGSNQLYQNKDSSSCDWESLISDAPDLLIFESPDDKESYKDSVDPETSIYASNRQVAEGTDVENLSTQPGEGEGCETMRNVDTHDMIVGLAIENPDQKMDLEQLSGFYRGVRRRCLQFEMGGSVRKNFDQNSVSATSMLLQSDGNTSSNGQHIVRTNTGIDASRCVIPGIGLHLNALATTSRDRKIVNHETSASGRLLIGPNSSVNYHPPTTGQGFSDNSLVVASAEKEIANIENSILPVENACQVSGYLAIEGINQSSSPKKKRRRTEQAVEAESCKRCNCKKSKCLKLYCECFAAGVYCVEPCACIDCFNKPLHEQTVIATRKQIESRNPLAFAPRVIRSSDTISETGDDSSRTPASARHKRGCNCKKSGCLKKYCECYQGGVGCSINCRCEGCKNAFGRKDGSGIISSEVEIEDDESNITEKSVTARSFIKIAIRNDIEQKMESVPLATPLQAVRPVQPSFSSKEKPPRSSISSIGSSSGHYAIQGYGKPNFFQPPPAFDKHTQAMPEDDEIPEILQDSSPISGVKSSSPNQKRISPPRSLGMSPGLRTSRKLILRSIPSFPSLTNNQ